MSNYKFDVNEVRKILLLQSSRVIVCCQDRRICFECHSFKYPLAPAFWHAVGSHTVVVTPVGSLHFVDVYAFSKGV